jgi:hypothetical protein
MFGHVDTPKSWARHLVRAREQQKRSGGFTEFVPLPFVPMESPIYLQGRARRGPTFREALFVHAVARLALHPLITNIQASWVKLGPEGTRECEPPSVRRRSPADGRRGRSSHPLPKERPKGAHGVVDRFELGLLERSQPLRKPRCSPGGRAPQETQAVPGESETDPAAVAGRSNTFDQACMLETVDVPGERGRGDPLRGRELRQRVPGALLHQPEQCLLAGCDPCLLRLLPELAREAE